ncbi:MAG: MFS transporter, partial [Candidatus Eisenbacteria bacterium]|nr:MFS transporter [Candidatus Eisenbacteria bacterium]
MRIESAPCDEASLRSGAGPCATAPADRPWVLAASILASGVGFLNGSVVSIALPAIQQDLGATLAGIQWILNSYALLLGALILASGAAGDRYGRRRVFRLGLSIFSLGSIACALAPGTTSLIAARSLQGLGSAMYVPASLALLSAAYPAESRGRAIGTWSALTSV